MNVINKVNAFDPAHKAGLNANRETIAFDPHRGLNVNQMTNMVMGSPTPFSLPIGSLRQGDAVNYKHGGMVEPMLSKALGSIVEHRPNVVRQGLHLIDGGVIPTIKGRPPKEELVVMPTKGVDQVPAMLQCGEIVIPKKYAPRIATILQREGIHLPNM